MNTEPANSEPIVPVPISTPDVLEPSGFGFRKIFMGPNGIRAGWRLATFVLLFAALELLIVRWGMPLIPGVAAIANHTKTGGVLTPQFELIFEGASLAVAFLAAGIMSRIEKRPFSAYGIPWSGAFGKLFWSGVLWGLAFETLTMLAISAFRGFTFGTFAIARTALFTFGILWAIGFVLVGMFEEFLFRGYAQFTLASGIGFWPAALLLSALFGALHLPNPGEGWVGALSVFVFGVFGCFTLRRTGSLWFAIGLHAAADYAETFIFSVPDSGMTATGHLLNSSLHGPRWLTGGSIGPEGSLMSFLLLAISFAAFNWLYPAKKAEGSR